MKDGSFANVMTGNGKKYVHKTNNRKQEKIHEIQKYLENIKINCKVQKYKSCRATTDP